MAVEICTVAVPRGVLARQILRIGDIASVGTAVVGRRDELDCEAAVAGARRMLEGGIVRVTLHAGALACAVVIAMLLAGTAERGVAAVSRS